MADKTIEQLPLLSIDDFNPATDFIIVQKPNGATYKMLGGGGTFAASVAARKAYADSSIATMNHNSPTTIQFLEDSLFALNSAININIDMKILAHGHRANHGSVSEIPAIGSSRSLSFTKPSGINALSGSQIGSGGSGTFTTFRRQTGSKSKSTSWYDRIYKYSFSTKQDSFNITFSSQDAGFLQSNSNRPPDFPFSSTPEWYPASQVEILVSLSGSIQP